MWPYYSVLLSNRILGGLSSTLILRRLLSSTESTSAHAHATKAVISTSFMHRDSCGSMHAATDCMHAETLSTAIAADRLAALVAGTRRFGCAVVVVTWW